jgi:hypothetical protein
MKTERRPLFVAESGAFVEDGCIKKIHTTKARMKCGNVHSSSGEIQSAKC